jgi:hypothetical protein
VVRIGVACWVILAAVCLGCSGAGQPSNGTKAPDPATTAVRALTSPSASLEPNRGRPGTEVVVTGSGWQAGDAISIRGTSAGASPEPYATATATADGSFTARFRLDRSPTGASLNPGRINLVAASAMTSVPLAFDVLPPLPGGIPGPGGPGG